MSKPGPVPFLNEEMFKKIKKCIIEGNNLGETAKICGINEDTFYVYHADNYLDLANRIEGWKRDRKLMLANKNIEEFLTMNDYVDKVCGEDLISVKDPAMTRIRADITKFVAETLDKENYSKRSELTGKGGTTLVPENTALTMALAEQLNNIEKNAIHTGTSKPSDGTVADALGS